MLWSLLIAVLRARQTAVHWLTLCYCHAAMTSERTVWMQRPAVLTISLWLSACLPITPQIYQTRSVTASSLGQAAVIARHGPPVYGRMLDRGQVGLSGSVYFDAVAQESGTRADGVAAHRSPRWSGAGVVQVGVARGVELGVGVSGASSVDSVPVATDAPMLDPLHSAHGEGSLTLRAHYAFTPEFAVLGGAEFGIQCFPSLRTITTRDAITTHYPNGATDTTTRVDESFVRTTTVGAMFNLFAAFQVQPLRWLELELAGSSGVFTSSAGLGYAQRILCNGGSDCVIPVTELLGVQTGATATAWLGATIGSGPVQWLLRGSATSTPVGASTGAIWGANTQLRFVLGSAPTQTQTTSQPSASQRRGAAATRDTRDTRSTP